MATPETAPPRPNRLQRAGRVVKHSLLLCIPAFALNLFFQGRREFKKERELAEKIHRIRKG